MDLCQDKCIHKDQVEYAFKRFPDPAVIDDVAAIFKALGEPTRLKIVIALLHAQLCVCDLSVICGLSESAVSHQLRILRNLRVVRNRREGKIVYYQLDDNHVRHLIRNSLKHAAEHS